MYSLKQKDMIDFLKTIVNIDSGTSYKKGVDNMGEFYAQKLLELGFAVDVKKCELQGNTVIAIKRGEGSGIITFIGHLDTVYEKGIVKKRGLKIKDNKIWGAGVADMKGGLVTLYFGLKVILNKLSNKDFKEIRIILSGDEEQGSLHGRNYLEECSKGSDLVLSMEPARADGSIVTGRWGITVIDLKIKGKTAHAMNNPEKGIDALESLSELIVEVKEFSRKEKNINISFGKTTGGKGVGISVPEMAKTNIAVGYKDRPAYKRAKNMINNKLEKEIILKDFYLKENHLFLPMIPHKSINKYIKLIKKIGRENNISLQAKVVGGPGDGGFITSQNIPVVGGMGPVGGNLHSSGEYIICDSLIERSKLLILVIMELLKKDLL